MDCNKDEAIRAKDIAERKFTEKDFSGAKKFALKAQTLYPGLEGISQMLTTLDVYIYSENKVGGEPDFYGILGVNPLADDETIKKQYRKLVLLLHPDKNKSIGADGAFRSLTDAYNVLSDKLKRSAYNTKRHIQMAQKVPSQSRVSVPQCPFGTTVELKVPARRVSVPQPPFGTTVELKIPARRVSKKPSKSGKSRKGGTREASPNAQPLFPQDDDTFWTVCTGCQMKYEYMRIYLNQMLKCPECKAGFFAVEVPPPSNIAPLRPAKQQRVASSNARPQVSGSDNPFGGSNAHWSPCSGTTATGHAARNSGSGPNQPGPGNMGTGTGNGYGSGRA